MFFSVAHLPSWLTCDGFFGQTMLVALLEWTVAGMLFATMTILSGRIWPAILFHTAHNLLAGLSYNFSICDRVPPA